MEISCHNALRNDSQPGSSSETQGLPVGTMRYFRASDIFGAKVYFKCWRAPGCFFLPNESQKSQNPFPRFTRKIFFWPINEEISPGNSVSLLHELVFFIDRTGRFPWGVSEKKDLTKQRKLKILTWELVILFHQFSRPIYRKYIVKLTTVVFFFKIEINLYSKSTRFLLCSFCFRGKLVENTSFIISPRSLHNFWNFPRYANHRCKGHAAMSTEHWNDRLI